MNEEEDDSSFHSCSSGNNGVGSLVMHDNAEVNWNPTTLLVLNDITFDTVFANIVGVCLVNGIIRKIQKYRTSCEALGDCSISWGV